MSLPSSVAALSRGGDMVAGNGKPRKNGCRLDVPTGTPPPEMLLEFALNCLVPLLADMCIQEWQAARRETEVTANIATAEPFLERERRFEPHRVEYVRRSTEFSPITCPG